MSSKEFAAQTFKWLYQVNWDADLMPVDVKVAVQLTRHFNEDDGGRAFPGYETIAEGCKADDGREAYTKSIGVSEHTVIRSVRRMSQRGHLRVEWGAPGRGRPNQYWMILKPARVQVKKKAGKPAPVTRKPAPVQNKTCTGAGEPLKITTEGTTQVRVAPQLGARGGPKKRRTNGASEKQTDAAAERFPDFWSAYPRQHDRLKAERAFKEALKHATADEIIAGARRYANDATRCRQEREAGSLGYTTFPANWLRDRGWLNAYSNGGVTLDQHGNEIVTSRGPKASWLDTIPDDWDELWRAP